MKSDFLLNSEWGWLPGCRLGEVEYALFRKTCNCSRPTPFELAVSADSRYKLYLDGRLLGCGPCRSDLQHYCYEVYSGTLAPGRHVFAAEVVCFRNGFRGDEGVWSEIHHGGGFWAAGMAGDESLATPGCWRGIRDASRSLRLWRDAWVNPCEIPAPPMEAVDFSNSAGDWKSAAFDDSAWQELRSVGAVCLRGVTAVDPGSPWWLEERRIPQMSRSASDIAAILSAEHVQAELRDEHLIVSAPAGKHVVLVDLGRYQTVLTHLAGSCRAGEVRIAYAEKLFGPGSSGRRNPFPGGRIGQYGYADLCRYASDRRETFDSFWYRAGRFVELAFQLEYPGNFEFSVEEFHYPFDLKVQFRQKGVPDLEKLFDISWNTALACAHEHYEDCPYYEQLQYVGDTRIQALISYAVTGDDRLGRQALIQFHRALSSEGLTPSRYPCGVRQYIPLFSLYWILMVEDHYRYFGDRELVCELWRGIRHVLDYFEEKRDPETGLIGPLPYWTFADWTAEWPAGRCDRGMGLPDALTSLIYAECCCAATRLGTEIQKAEADFPERRRKTLDALRNHCFDADAGCFTDLPGKPFYSEQVNIWALLADAAPSPAEAQRLLEQLNASNSWSKCSLFFSFYFLELLRAKGAMADFETLLERWRRLLPLGFTTFPETPDEFGTRSDCHAWSASPAYEIVRTYFGVSPLSPGFEEVEIAPLPGSMRELTASVPIGNRGMLELAWKIDKDGGMTLYLTADIDLKVRVKLPGGAPVKTMLTAGQQRSFSTSRDLCCDPVS